MTDELFTTSLGDDLDPSLFEFTAGSGYADNVNLDAGKAIAYATSAWFFGPVSPYEYIGRIEVTLAPSLGAGGVTTAIPASTGGWKMGGAGVWGGSTPASNTIPEIDVTTGLPTVSLTGFLFGGGTTEEGVAEAVSTIPEVEAIVTEEGGFVFCGPEATGDATTTFPASEVIETEGGWRFGGAGVWGQVRPADLPSAVLVSTVGFVLSGSGLAAEPGVTPTTTVIVSTGGWKMGGRAPDRVEVTYPADVDRVIVSSGGWAFGGDEGVWEDSTPTATVIESLGALFLIGGGGLATSRMPPIAIISGDAQGGFVLSGGGLTDPDAVYETWVLNAQSFEPSVFSGFNFNSFCEKDGKAYACGDAGIYLLGGDHDAGEPIRTGCRVGPANFGHDREKRLRGVQFGAAGPQTQVRVRTETGEGVFSTDRDSNRVTISRDLQGAEFTLDFLEFDELSHCEIFPLLLARR